MITWKSFFTTLAFSTHFVSVLPIWLIVKAVHRFFPKGHRWKRRAPDVWHWYLFASPAVKWGGAIIVCHVAAILFLSVLIIFSHR